jgi:hypothetical protein
MENQKMYDTPKTIKQAYDIASTFIIDKDTDLKSHSDNWCVVYTISKTFVNKKPYCLEIQIPRNIPKKNKNNGSITLYQAQDDEKTNLFNVKTKHSVGQILRDSIHLTKTRNLNVFLEKLLSYRFYKLIKLIEKRTSAQLKRQDKTLEILNMIRQIKESQR